ncbi:hypothetical protein CC78DRAFT_617451 [Lojkania enalia]|uniref:Ubiquitin-like domain-containing protein n=1 Tax=Lojkania enalia TaxID=147567 RepID=A0A9P4N838_9PLEO|nr:hypothetical protein CC78DRAFT_617451 [Didymosphaeria enalia]
MAVPFGFSVGDIIAGTNLLITSINAIRDGGGSASEYQAVTATLRQVSTALEGLNELRINDANHLRALEVAASQCGATIYQFVNKIGKYHVILSPDASVKSWKSVLRKIEWSLYSKEDVRRFQAQLQGDLLALQTTLQRVQLSIMTSSVQETRSALIRVETRLAQASATQALILQALSRCFEQFRGFVLMVFFANMRIINYLLSAPRLSSRIQEERPVYLDDPHGRIIPFLRSWIMDWDDFETILKVQFKRVPGIKKIAAGEYYLRDAFRTEEITRSMSVDSVFVPGRKLIMGMVFSASNIPKLCPKCFSSVESAIGGNLELKCSICGACFSRGRKTRSEDDNTTDTQNPLLPIWRYEAWPQRPIKPIVHNLCAATEQEALKGTSKTTLNFPFECVEDFSRVRLIEKPRKAIQASQNREKYPNDDEDSDDLMLGEDPILQRLRQYDNNEHVNTARLLTELLTMDNDHGRLDAAREFSRSLVKDGISQYSEVFTRMEELWDQKEFSQMCLLAEMMHSTSYFLGLAKVENTFWNLYQFMSVPENDENLRNMRGLLDRAKLEVISGRDVLLEIFDLRSEEIQDSIRIT